MATTNLEVPSKEVHRTDDGQVSEAAAESTFAEVDDHDRVVPAIEFRDVVLSDRKSVV